MCVSLAADTFGSLEAVKTVADLVLPCDGEIVTVNPSVKSEAILVNQDPYGEGVLSSHCFFFFISKVCERQMAAQRERTGGRGRGGGGQVGLL